MHHTVITKTIEKQKVNNPYGTQHIFIMTLKDAYSGRYSYKWALHLQHVIN